ncbi:unnamed protein product [Adineta steineri]|uniref:NAD(P)(+)--arginine ADP-ribosyltransferase n=1 Tax=Adineta steineri TaxID=433720 RepID=A0A815ZG93_9BILA|nr:unnamed protein product [Adineta steineri]CAF1584223.1 unnamed protein product [Adineta steineri]
MTSSIPTKSSITNDFYYACRNGLIDIVQQELPNMSLEEIDQVQANGSTALHAASYNGHTEIVKLLLEKGACRSIPNTYKCLPFDEAKSTEIKELFLRRSNRFTDEESGHIDWMKCDAAAEQLAKDYRYRHSGLGWTSKNIEHRLKYIKDEMSHTEQERISTFLNQVQHDPESLLRAYTVESSFYIKLNKDLAMKHFEQGTNFGLTYFIDFFYNHPAFQSLSYIGNVYRGMTVTHDDLKEYKVGNKIMNKAFMSTTIERQVAEDFARKEANHRKTKNGDLVKLSVLCSFQIVNHRTGLNIENISKYRHEKEILIGPYTAFSITAVRQIAHNYAEIDLRECQIVHQDENHHNVDDDDFD